MSDAPREVAILDTMFSRDGDDAKGKLERYRARGWSTEGRGPETEIDLAIELHRRSDHANAWVPTGDNPLDPLG